MESTSTLFTVDLIVTPRPGVRDPQAEAVTEALQGLESQAQAPTPHVLCVGRFLRLQLAAADGDAARTRAEQLCRELLVNPSLESFQLRIEAASA